MKTNPSWDVDALPYGELDNDTSRILGEYLAFQYDRLNLEEKVNKALLYGLLYGLGIFQYGYDDKLDDGEGNAWIEKLGIQYDHNKRSFRPVCWFTTQSDSLIPFMENEQIAVTIIYEMEDELKLILL